MFEFTGIANPEFGWNCANMINPRYLPKAMVSRQQVKRDLVLDISQSLKDEKGGWVAWNKRHPYLRTVSSPNEKHRERANRRLHGLPSRAAWLGGAGALAEGPSFGKALLVFGSIGTDLCK